MFGQRTLQYITVIILLVALGGAATYAVMSDTSIHGLTVKFYDVSRYCTPTGSTDVQNPESHGTDQTPRDIFRSPTNNG